MNRTIKFRAWDEYEKRMIPHEELSEDPQEFFAILNGGVAAIVMQFTGLTNRNGVEIYEGDVIEVNIPYRRTQTHTGDNIPLGRYTEPLEPAIERKIGVVVYHSNQFVLVEIGWMDDFIEATNEGLCIHSGEAMSIEWLLEAMIPDFYWCSPIDAENAKELFAGGWSFEWEGEEGELAFLLDELGLESEGELISYLQPKVIGSIHTHPELVGPNQKDTTP